MSNEIRILLKELMQFKSTLIVVAFCGIVLSAAESQMAIMTKRIGDALQEKNPDMIVQVPAQILLLAFVMALSRYFHLYLMDNTADRFTMHLRVKLQKKFMQLNLNFHNNFKSGSGGLISRILNDIIIIRDGLRMFADFFSQPLLLIFLITWLFYLNWKLTASIFIILPILLSFIRQIGRSLRKYGESSQNNLEKITSTIKETLDGIRVIQSFNLEQEMENKFKSESSHYLADRSKINSRIELAGPVTEFIATAVIVSIFVYLGLDISSGKATLGDFTGYLGGLLMFQKPIKKIQDSYVRIQETIVATKRVFSILDDQNTVSEALELVPFPTNWKTILYKNVSFSYGKEIIIKNLNLTIHRGEIVALVGESGSGKSTIANLLERFFEPTHGEILIDDVPIDKISLKELRHNIALVTQDVFLFSDSVERNIQAGDFSRDISLVEQSSKDANAHDFISRLSQKYVSQVGDRGSLLSGGEKQRISIARALFKNAPILILDEATSALDSASEVEVQKGLDRLIKGRTSIVIAHRLSTIQHADKVVVLKKGEIVESGTHTSLLNLKGEYFKFYQLQSSI